MGKIGMKNRKKRVGVDCKEICEWCNGTGRMKVIDRDETYAQATCGENRTHYKYTECKKCR